MKYKALEVPQRLLIEVKVLAARRKTQVRLLVEEAVTAWLVSQGVELPKDAS